MLFLVIAIETGEIFVISKLLDEIESPYLKITLDVGHVFWQIWNSPFEKIEDYIKKEIKNIINIHAHDHNMQTDHLPITKGVIDYRSIIKCLKKLNYKGSITLEIHPHKYKDIIDSLTYLKKYESEY